MKNSTTENHAMGDGTNRKPFQINEARLRATLDAASAFGRTDDGKGVCRPSFSDADMAARHWLISELEASGLDAWMDPVGNVFGRWNAGQGPAVIIGSHLDSVPDGGRLDGTLGVLAGLECIRSLQDQGFEPKCPIEVLATSEEEGRFGGMLGSQALAGLVSQQWLQNAKDDSGTSLRDAMARHGLEAADALIIKRAPSTVRAFLELHIEQGPVLDEKKIPVGVVTGISGCANWSLTLTGLANHAGTTPMDMRADAFAGLADFASTIPQIIEEYGTDQSRLTIGKVDITPNFPHTVPGEAQCSLILRDMDENIMRALADACWARLEATANAHKLQWDIQLQSWLPPAPCDNTMINLLKKQAESLGIPTMTMPSGAGHDTQSMAQLTAAGLLFVPSINGISHSTEEDTDWADINKGCTVLLNTVAALAS